MWGVRSHIGPYPWDTQNTDQAYNVYNREYLQSQKSTDTEGILEKREKETWDELRMCENPNGKHTVSEEEWVQVIKAKEVINFELLVRVLEELECGNDYKI